MVCQPLCWKYLFVCNIVDKSCSSRSVWCSCVLVFLCSCILVFLCSCVLVFLFSCVLVILCSCVPLFLCSCVLVFLCYCVLVFLYSCVLLFLCSCVLVVLYSCVLVFPPPPRNCWKVHSCMGSSVGQLGATPRSFCLSISGPWSQVSPTWPGSVTAPYFGLI